LRHIRCQDQAATTPTTLRERRATENGERLEHAEKKATKDCGVTELERSHQRAERPRLLVHHQRPTAGVPSCARPQLTARVLNYNDLAPVRKIETMITAKLVCDFVSNRDVKSHSEARGKRSRGALNEVVKFRFLKRSTMVYFLFLSQTSLGPEKTSPFLSSRQAWLQVVFDTFKNVNNCRKQNGMQVLLLLCFSFACRHYLT